MFLTLIEPEQYTFTPRQIVHLFDPFLQSMEFFCMFCLFCHSHEALFCLWIQRSHGAAEPFVTCEIVLHLREEPESFTAACNLPAELPLPQGLFAHAADFQSKLSS